MEILKKVSEGAKTLTEGAKSGAKSISKKSSDLVGVAKLKYEMGKLEKEMENNLTALGNLFYLQHKGEKELEEEMERLLGSTKALENDIAELDLQISKFMPKPLTCLDCQMELPDTANYCFACGSKIIRDDVSTE